MSSRQLRKLQKQKELDLATEVSEESDGIEEAPATTKPRVSLFAALGGDEGDGGDDGQDDEDQEPAEAQQQMSDTQTPTTAKKSKKKKKKKKAKTVPTPEGPEEDEDEIDKAIRALNISTGNIAGSSTAAPAAAPNLPASDVLNINSYHLKAINEMRNLFGREIISSAQTEEEQEQHRQRRHLRMEVDLETYLREPPGAPKLSEVSLRRNPFIQGKEHWPKQSAGGLTLKEVERAPNGSWTEYSYGHDKEYDTVQCWFFACVQMGDPMRMVHLAKKFPYHVSTLLQVSSVAKQDQNMALAAELCERALFSFGRVATTAFRQNVEQGRARLDFRRPENRQFWLAGYHYLKSLIRKGTYRTALEWAKLLYALNSEDPYAMRHFVHFLAIRAHESSWLVDFLEEMETTSDNRDTIYLRQSLVLAKLQLGDTEGARKDLVSGMQRVPWLYCALFQELGLDAPPSIWGINADSDARSFWVKLYVYQAKDLWNNGQATALLQDVAKTISRVETSKLPHDDAPPDLGVTRLAYLEGQTSLLSVAPRQLLDSQPNYEFDPLPPAEADNIFSSDGVRLPWEDRLSAASQAQADIMARMHNMMPPRVAGGAGGAGFAENARDDDDEEGGPNWDDDEELQRDLAAHADRANAPGMMAALMNLLGGGRGEQAARGLDDDLEEAEGLPGSWPDEEGGRDEAHDGRQQR